VKTTLLLVRHATCERMAERLNGRTADVSLTEAGRREAAAVGRRLAALRRPLVFSSSRGRAIQTAEIVAAPHGVEVRVEPALDEVDFGLWSGMSFTALAKDGAWHGWNEDRARARAPGGESMADVQLRVLSLMRSLAGRHSGATIVLVSHAEVIRAALLYMYGLPFDLWGRLEVAPASVFTVSAGSRSMRLLANGKCPAVRA
jgi:ribonuclease H / adenosylcobalamin/alpha-ribazole phosphatase